MSPLEILGWCFGCGEQVQWLSMDHHPHIGSGSGHKRCGPVWPMIRVRDQEELEAGASELLQIEAPGHALEWVPGRGRIDLMQWLVPEFTAHYRESDTAPSTTIPPDNETAQAVAQLARAAYKQQGLGLIDWLRISADPDGPPIDLADVREVVQQARDAGVRVWIERLGSDPFEGHNPFDCDGRDPRHCLNGGTPLVLRSAIGADHAEWPPDLRTCRELPEVGL